MTLKEATANSLLMFVAATCVVLIVKAVSPTPQMVPVGAGGSAGGGSELAVQDGVRVYYIHSNFRCSTCRSIEEYAKEAVESGFPEELGAGKVEWHAVNFQTPGNEHYAVDYEIVAPSVILARFEGGQQVEWKALPEVWELVGDKAAYLTFVQSSLREFLGGPPAQVPTLAAPLFKPPIPEMSESGAPASDLPVPAGSDSALPLPEPSEPQSPLPETASFESPEPASPLRSPAASPQFFLPMPE